jgi:hypothetical protein
MIFFSKNKLKVRNESTKKSTKFCIEYYNLKEYNNFKIQLLKEMFKLSNDISLMIVDTTLSYNQTQKDKQDSIDRLTNLLDSIDIKYKKMTVKPTENKSGLAAMIKLNNNKKNKDYILGLVVSEKTLENLESIIKLYNIHYYINPISLRNDDLLEEIETYYYDEDELHLKFKYSIFDCTSIKNMAISSEPENEELINNIINNIKKDFQ